MKCPHNDDKFDCGSVIEEREIRAVSQCTIPIPRPLFHLLLIIHTILFELMHVALLKHVPCMYINVHDTTVSSMIL